MDAQGGSRYGEKERTISEPARPAPRHLRVIDTQTGELADDCESCRALSDQLAGLDRDLRAWRARYADLKRDREGEARASEYWQPGEWLFNHWRHVCNHPRAVFTVDRFWLVHPFLSNARYGKTMRDRVAVCRLAINGAAFDAFTKVRKNGTVQRFDDWSLIFRDAAHMEEFANKAPRRVGP